MSEKMPRRHGATSSGNLKRERGGRQTGQSTGTQPRDCETLYIQTCSEDPATHGSLVVPASEVPREQEYRKYSDTSANEDNSFRNHIR